MDAQDAIERMCNLQTEVQEHLGEWGYSADCFCGKSGFWSGEKYDGTFANGYRNDGKALEFIEQAVRERIANDKEQAKDGT